MPALCTIPNSGAYCGQVSTIRQFWIWNKLEYTRNLKCCAAHHWTQSCSVERLKNRRKHFSGLLGQPPPFPDANFPIRDIQPLLDKDIDRNPSTLEKLRLAKKQIFERKAYGHGGDVISPEVMKCVDIDDIVLQCCYDALSDGSIPDQSKLCNIISVLKRGDLTETDNCRRISLTVIVS